MKELGGFRLHKSEAEGKTTHANDAGGSMRGKCVCGFRGLHTLRAS